MILKLGRIHSWHTNPMAISSPLWSCQSSKFENVKQNTQFKIKDQINNHEVMRWLVRDGA